MIHSPLTSEPFRSRYSFFLRERIFRSIVLVEIFDRAESCSIVTCGFARINSRMLSSRLLSFSPTFSPTFLILEIVALRIPHRLVFNKYRIPLKKAFAISVSLISTFNRVRNAIYLREKRRTIY